LDYPGIHAVNARGLCDTSHNSEVPFAQKY